jgi:hypothetical protein
VSPPNEGRTLTAAAPASAECSSERRVQIGMTKSLPRNRGRVRVCLDRSHRRKQEQGGMGKEHPAGFAGDVDSVVTAADLSVTLRCLRGSS